MEQEIKPSGKNTTYNRRHSKIVLAYWLLLHQDDLLLQCFDNFPELFFEIEGYLHMC